MAWPFVGTILRTRGITISSVSVAIILILSLVAAIQSPSLKKSEALPPPNDLTFAAAGDWSCDGVSYHKPTQVIKAMNGRQPELVLGLGDYSYKSTMSCWHGNITALAPVYVHGHMHNPTTIALGNHENNTCTNCGGQQLSDAGRAELLNHFNITNTYYSFDFKKVHFLVLDPNPGIATSPGQISFAKSDLERASQNTSIAWIVVYFHQPMYTSRIYVSSSTCSTGPINETSFRNAYQPLFDANRVDLVLQGHIHFYERMKPMTFNGIITDSSSSSDYVNPRGQVFVTVGTGGAGLSGHCTAFPPVAMSAKRLSENGFLQLNITNGWTKLSGQFVNYQNVTNRDLFTISKSKDAGAVYRSNTGAGLNTAKYREWNGTSGIWSAEKELPTTGSAIREAKIYYSPISRLRIAVSLSQDGSINMFSCSGACTTANNWVNVNGARLAFANSTLPGPFFTGKSIQYFDGAFETTSGRFVVAYNKNNTATHDFFYYRTFDPNTGTLSQENSVDYNTGGSSHIREIRYFSMASNPSNNTIVMIMSDRTNKKAIAFVWNPSGSGSWGNQFTLTTSVPSDKKGIGVAFERSSKAAVIFASTDSGGIAKWSRWTGSWAGAQSTTPSKSTNPRYTTMKADPASNSNKIMICIEGTGSTQTIACAQENNNTMGSWTTHTIAPANANRRNFDFCWDPSGSTGLIVYSNRTAGQVQYKTWSGSSWGSVKTTGVSNTGSWISCDTNPSSVDTIKSLWTKQDGSNSFGALKWDGNTLALISNNNPFTSSGGSTLEANGIAFQRSQ